MKISGCIVAICYNYSKQCRQDPVHPVLCEPVLFQLQYALMHVIMHINEMKVVKVGGNNVAAEVLYVDKDEYRPLYQVKPPPPGVCVLQEYLEVLCHKWTPDLSSYHPTILQQITGGPAHWH